MNQHATAYRAQGMFAVAVWDERQQVGLLARDRMGKKPVYYWQHRGAVYFASELKALLATEAPAVSAMMPSSSWVIAPRM